MKVLSNPCTVVFSEDLHLFAGLFGTEDFFERWEEKQFSVVSIFDDEHVRDYFQRTYFNFMRTASFSNEALFGHLDGDDNTPLRSGGSSEKRLRIMRREGKMWIGLHELEKFMTHQTHNKSGNHGVRCPLRVPGITKHWVNCGSTLADRSTAQNYVVNSWTRGICRTDRSHMIWAFEEITHPISCNLCAQEFVDFRTYYAHVRLTHLSVFPITDDSRESTCPACSTTQTPQATLKICT